MYPTPSSVGSVLTAQQRCRRFCQDEVDVAVNGDRWCRLRLLTLRFLFPTADEASKTLMPKRTTMASKAEPTDYSALTPQRSSNPLARFG